jgi:hypothetical protein
VVLAVLIVFGVRLLRAGRSARVPPPVTRPASPAELISYSELTAPMIRFRTTEYTLPGGWAAAMAPALVDWERSSAPPTGGVYRILNLNHGGSPIDGTTVLRSALVTAAGIDHAEFIIVPLDRLGEHGVIAHAMIRFVFTPEHPLVLLNADGTPEFGDPGVGDLVLSWEAWRAPGQDFQVIAGLDPRTFGLSLRAYTGPQRFLEDALQNRDWFVHPLTFPDGAKGAAEFLRIMLTLGDSVGRKSLSRVYSEAEQSWPPSGTGDGEETDWQELAARLSENETAPTIPGELTDRELGYQTVQRSCATMALYCLDLAVASETGAGNDSSLTLNSLIGPIEPWMKAVAHARPEHLFRYIPSIIAYIVRHPQIVPSRIPPLLEREGLLRREGGQVVTLHYSFPDRCPYGDIARNLIR